MTSYHIYSMMQSVVTKPTILGGVEHEGVKLGNSIFNIHMNSNSPFDGSRITQICACSYRLEDYVSEFVSRCGLFSNAIDNFFITILLYFLSHQKVTEA